MGSINNDTIVNSDETYNIRFSRNSNTPDLIAYNVAGIWRVFNTSYKIGPLRWRHNDHAGVSNHQPPGCLLNRLFRRKSKKTSKLRVTGLCAGNSPGTGEFSAQMASYAENVSIWWRHHAIRHNTTEFWKCVDYMYYNISHNVVHNTTVWHPASTIMWQSTIM